MLLRHPVEVVLWRRRTAGQADARRIRLRQIHDAIGLVERQAAEDDGVDDGEDGGAGADAEREHDERDQREAGRGAKGAKRVAEVGHGPNYLPPILMRSPSSTPSTNTMPATTRAKMV